MTSTQLKHRILCTGASGFIGSHLLDRLLLDQNVSVLNIDIAEPKDSVHHSSWLQGDILNNSELARTFQEYRPTHVIHLAARATMDGKSLADYPENVQGVRNVLEAARRVPCLERLIVTSSQHVRKPGSPLPVADSDYEPYEAYGQSKAVTEQLTRDARLDCPWTIIRPTTVWGPRSEVLANGVWRAIAAGMYVHPAGDKVVRGYGYVKNVVEQIIQLAMLPRTHADRMVLYVGDKCIPQLDWVNAFSRALTGRTVRTAPFPVLLGLATLGELARKCGFAAPIYMARFKNMTTSNPVPMETGLRLLGAGSYSLMDGVSETVAWLRESRRPSDSSARHLRK